MKTKFAIISLLMLFAPAFAAAQLTGCNPGDTVNTYPCETALKFDTAYWNSQPAPVRALEGMRPEICSIVGDGEAGGRCHTAFALAKQGFAIDVPIMQWGWDAYTVETLRQQYGYTWVPSALGSPVYLPPGLSFPNLAPYDPANPEPGSIRVDNNAADYKPSSDCSTAPVCVGFSAPAAPAPAANAIGPDLEFQATVTFGSPSQSLSAEVHSSAASQHNPEGTVVTDPASGARCLYHLLGNELMNPLQRVGVWLCPIPANAIGPFTVTF